MKPFRVTRFWASVLVCSVGACSLDYDDSSSELSKGSAELRKYSPWSTPTNVGAPLNTVYNDMYAFLTRDGLTVYFSSDRPGGLGGDDLWVSHRDSVDSPWQTPVNLAVLNTPNADSLSVLDNSEDIMYFFSDRGGGCSPGDLWTSDFDHATGQWTTPVNMGCVVNSPFQDNAPAFYANDDAGTATIYFGSNRHGGVGDFDVYQTTTTDTDLHTATWSAPQLVPEISSPARDTRTFVRHDGRELFITTGRAGGLGGLDMWVATRDSNTDPWSTPIDVGAPISSSADDGSPWLSRDGHTLYFFSTRAGGLGGRDIYFSTR
jgi:hypothetical protein